MRKPSFDGLQGSVSLSLSAKILSPLISGIFGLFVGSSSLGGLRSVEISAPAAVSSPVNPSHHGCTYQQEK